MFGLLRLLSRFGPLLIFLFLESVCMILIVRLNDSQARIFASSASVVSGAVLQTKSQFSSFIGMKKEIAALQQRIATLENQRPNAFYYDQNRTDTAFTKIDTTGLKQMYVFTPANIINNSITGKQNMMTINRGKKHGVLPPMAVISHNGVIGIVRHSTDHFASVMSALNTNTRISASVRGKSYFGSLIWKGQDPRYLHLVDVPKHNIVNIGDTIETSGFSNLFPKGVPIGTVANFKVGPGESNQQIQVRLLTDFSTVRQVLVVKNLFYEELKALQQQSDNE
ncbi:MAG: rod shape-determining protein MreC [Saprospiraceae bacterium]|jgi:rod shape-determining protein MreC